MIAEFGHFALILGLCMACVQAILPLLGAWKNNPAWMAAARPAARAHLLSLTVAFGCLTYAFIAHDFSVAYVANHSNSKLPLLYRISAVWGAHEGSLLLWALILALWTGAVSLFSRAIPLAMLARVLGVMGLVSIGFLLFMLLTSNPFDRMFPMPLDGRDLNPLLQDPGLAIHPPMLYMGYVGFSVTFAFAIAAMLGGRLDAAWARWSRPWTNVAWMFLTAGIALGSWWAYYELGWGGWWFWDPVENASFMPWLVGTALMHSLAVTEKRAAFKAWTVLLAILTFSLSLLGTFLVRSGVLTSVHAFASDPSRGVYILFFLAVVVGGSLFLFALRAPRIRSVAVYNVFSRETALLLNNILLVVVAASILLGTLYPLVLDALGVGKISVGPPYFNSVFVPLAAPLAILVGIGAMLRWRRDSFSRLARKLAPVLVISIALGTLLIVALAPSFSWPALFGMVLALWVVLSGVQLWRDRFSRSGLSFSSLRATPLGFHGMSLAHIGIAVFIVGVSLTTSYSQEKDVRLLPGESLEMGGYTFRFEGVSYYQGPNFNADEGTVRVFREGTQVAELKPQKRIYHTQRNPMTEAAIDAGLSRDLFVALGEPMHGKANANADDAGAWSLRVYHKPFIRWIWLGAIFMALGGLLAAADRRYRTPRRARVPA